MPGAAELEQWEPTSIYYRSSMQRIEKAHQNIAGVIWLQGYSNKNDSGYLEKLVALVNQLRTDLNQPDLPFIAAQVGVEGIVNDAIAALPANFRHCFCQHQTPSSWIRHTADRESQITIGQRFAAVSEHCKNSTARPKPGTTIE